MLRQTLVAVKVWDLPVRIFHWLLVALLLFQWVSGQVGDELMVWHAWCGYAVLVLVIFRILWGFLGGTHARFASFIAGPAAAYRFARRLFSREAVPQLGHNPLGGWMVMAMIASLALQAITGLFANDGLAVEGPLARLVSLDTSNRLAEVHRWNFNVLLGLSAVHTAAVLFHWLVKREDLILAMFTGVKRMPEALLHERRESARDAPKRRLASREPASVRFASPWLALGLLIAAMAFVFVLVRGPY